MEPLKRTYVQMGPGAKNLLAEVLRGQGFVGNGSSQPPMPNLKAVAFYAQFIGRGDLCFDVGANVGDRTRVFRKLGARVVAVEPQSACVRMLRDEFAADPNVTILHSALGEGVGQAEMLIAGSNDLSTLSGEWVTRAIPIHGAVWNDSETVSVVPLDSLIEQYGAPAFLKIDVEGFEREVLRGLSNPDGIKTLSFEFNTAIMGWARECVEYLSRFGEMTFNLCFMETFDFALPQWVDAMSMLDYLGEVERGEQVYGDVYVRLRPNPVG